MKMEKITKWCTSRPVFFTQ